MAINHCGFVPHQNKSINQRQFSQRDISAMIPHRNRRLDRCVPCERASAH